MKSRPYHFEIKDTVTQFIAAFDDIVIGRFNKLREETEQIKVRYLYAPKQRVMHDIINENKTITLPVVAVNIAGISRDTSRVFNKIDGFYYADKHGQDTTSTHVQPPVPIDIKLNLSVITRYQSDMDQILSNFIPFTNPYVVISWYLPEGLGLNQDQEIRSHALWDGSVSLNYPIELVASQKARITADTTFTVKGWLFQDNADPVGNIFKIDQNFSPEDVFTDYETMSVSDSPKERFTLSGSPDITDIFYNGVIMHDDITISPLTSGSVILNGTGLGWTENVLFSSNDSSAYTSLTSVSGENWAEAISGQVIDYTILNENTLLLNSPPITEGKIRFIPYNRAGYSFSDDNLHTQSLSSNSTFIIVE